MDISTIEVDEKVVAEAERLMQTLRREHQLTEEQVLFATVCAVRRQFQPEIVEEAFAQQFNSPTPNDGKIIPPTTINIPSSTTVADQTSSTAAPSKRRPIRAYLDGCFDLMHSGHYNAIRQAKAICDELVVGVHSDAEILRNKGPPVMNDEERLAAVHACKWIDQVEFDTPYTPSIELLDRVNCDFCVHGDDM